MNRATDAATVVFPTPPLPVTRIARKDERPEKDR
jgi:hypothetical protein